MFHVYVESYVNGKRDTEHCFFLFFESNFPAPYLAGSMSLGEGMLEFSTRRHRHTHTLTHAYPSIHVSIYIYIHIHKPLYA